MRYSIDLLFTPKSPGTYKAVHRVYFVGKLVHFWRRYENIDGGKYQSFMTLDRKSSWVLITHSSAISSWKDRREYNTADLNVHCTALDLTRLGPEAELVQAEVLEATSRQFEYRRIVVCT